MRRRIKNKRKKFWHIYCFIVMQEVSEEKTGGLIMNEKVRDIDALAGERWFPLETSIVDDMKNL